MAANNKRDRLIKAATHLFRIHGVHKTSLADIAKQARIPIGNVYYYFKTKEELALASIELRRQTLETAFKRLDEGIDDPRLRLIEALTYYDRTLEEYTKYGCPVSSIIFNGDTPDDPIVKAAASIHADFVSWAQIQFNALGHSDESRQFAIAFIAGIQGAIIMAKTFADEQLLSTELARLSLWVQIIPNKKIRLGKAISVESE